MLRIARLFFLSAPRSGCVLLRFDVAVSGRNVPDTAILIPWCYYSTMTAITPSVEAIFFTTSSLMLPSISMIL